MRWKPNDLDDDTMRKAAQEALTQPSDSAMWDDRLYRTHGAVIEWADRGNDILAESNFHAMLDALNGAVAHDESGASEARGDDVIDASVSHWLVGSLRQVFVRVYTDDTCTEYTPAFRLATALSLSLQDYPILDESDFSEREYEAWWQTVNQAIDDAARDYPDDTDAEREAFYVLLLTERDREDESLSQDGCNPDSVRWDHVAKLYAAVRNDHFEWLARRLAYAAPGQEPIPGL